MHLLYYQSEWTALDCATVLSQKLKKSKLDFLAGKREDSIPVESLGRGVETRAAPDTSEGGDELWCNAMRAKFAVVPLQVVLLRALAQLFYDTWYNRVGVDCRRNCKYDGSPLVAIVYSARLEWQRKR